MDIDRRHQLSIITAATDLIQTALEHTGILVRPGAEPHDKTHGYVCDKIKKKNAEMKKKKNGAGKDYSHESLTSHPFQTSQRRSTNEPRNSESFMN